MHGRGTSFITDTFKAANGRSPGMRWKHAKVKKLKSNVRCRNDKKQPVTSTPKVRNFARRLNFSGTGDKDYGTNPNYPDIDDEALNDGVSKLIKSKQVDQEKLQIQHSTVEQSCCDQWHVERRHRITAPCAGLLYSLQDSTNNSKVLENLLNPPPIQHLKSMHGRENEDYAKIGTTPLFHQKILRFPSLRA